MTGTDQPTVTAALWLDRAEHCNPILPTKGSPMFAAVADEMEQYAALKVAAAIRLASVSSASAGYTIEQGHPAATAPYACCVLAGRFVEDIGEWEMAVVSTPMSKPFTHWWPLPSSEPVPATNQAGEVERERVARIVYAWTPRIRSFENALSGELADAYRHADEVIAALATQPATSQEGEGCVDQQADDYAAEYVMTTEGNDYVPTEWERELIIDALHGFIADHWIAATPTPPTLSEDLREVIARTLYIRRNPSDYSSNDSYQWQIARGLDLPGYYADADAVLAKIPGFAVLSSDLKWFDAQRRLSLSFYSPMYGDDDDQSEEWRVHEESGPINDREWDVIGRGRTVAEAIAAARATLAQAKAS